MSMKRKKKATEAEAVGFSTDVPGEFVRDGRFFLHNLGSRSVLFVPLNESRMEIIIMDMKRPKDPHIMGWRRPYRSEKKVG